MQTLKFDDLPQGGFAGLVEKQFVMDSKAFGANKHPKASEGIGNFVYLADANFLPHGDTEMHDHYEVDVISVMVDGRIDHSGSLANGQNLNAGDVQVQRAGAEGFSHNEINPDNTLNQMIQLWVLPDQPGEPAGYRVYQPKTGERLHVYGGSWEQTERFCSHTHIDVANAQPGQVIQQDGEVMAYLSKGTGTANGKTVEERTLIQNNGLEFTANSDAQLILIYTD